MAEPMNLVLKRTFTGDGVTLGELFIDGTFFAFTLEPDDVGVTHPAIPVGRYKVIINYSIRFQRLLPLVIGVPGRLGIRVHPGNTARDTEGCILLGFSQSGNTIVRSRAACESFQHKIEPVLHAGEPVWLQVEVALPREGKKA